MKIGLYAHGGSGNHGCEALARSTMQLLGEHEYTLLSERPEEDLLYGLDKKAHIVSSKVDLPGGLGRLAYSAQMRLRRNDWIYWMWRYRDFGKKVEGLDLALSIGGDNYCYSGFTERFSILNRKLAEKGIPIVLWGCSIDRERITPAMLEDLGLYRLIVARESLTYGFLREAGLENVELMPDSAFLLEPKETPLPEGFVSGNMVGLNISPLVVRQEAVPGGIMRNCRALIDFILDSTDMGVALIPHVVWEGNDDREPLGELYAEYADTGRVLMVGDMDAGSLKGIIRHCRFMVAARTHASIAAYSTGVPALVLGYSVKSEGIATDLFGSASHYVLPIGELGEGNELKDAFAWLMDHEDDIRKHYGSCLGDYIGKLKRPVFDGKSR